jgi:hypothetical protein
MHSKELVTKVIELREMGRNDEIFGLEQNL